MIEHLSLQQVSRVPWRPHDTNQTNPTRQKILSRDGWCCQCCGHRTYGTDGYPQGYMEVHHLDGNHDNDNPANTVTVCPICHDTLHTGMATPEIRMTVVWIPEFTQVQINQLSIGLFLRMDAGYGEDDDAKQAVALYDQLVTRAEEASNRLNMEVLDIVSLATALTLLPVDSRDRDHLVGLRLLPSNHSFQTMAHYWAEHPGIPSHD